MSEYSPVEQNILLKTARETLLRVAAGQALSDIDLAQLSPALIAERACFVTLRQHHNGELRGCTGTLLARYPLIQEVVASTQQSALHDPRFMPVQAAEVPHLHIEISILTPMQALAYTSPDDLISRLRPEIDGVTLVYGEHRATFLPQVWERIPDPTLFLSMLTQKMGLVPDAWRKLPLTVYTYQSIIIEEARNFIPL